jgi:aldose 1-epimerase
MGITVEPWGSLPSGKSVNLYTLSDEITVKISDYGGTVTSIQVKDRDGRVGEVVLGFDNVNGYLNSPHYHGATIGRYANRISGGHFSIGDRSYDLSLNDGANHLHGGFISFDKQVWASDIIDDVSLQLTYDSVDGEEGYPGNLHVSVTFRVIVDRLEIDYHAISDRPTVVNMTNHAYYNLGDSENILEHLLWIDAENYSPVDEKLIPLGQHQDVMNTPFDFNKPRRIGDRIMEHYVQLIRANGYDHNYVLNQIRNPQIILSDPLSGRVLEISTTMPGVQFYSGNFLDGRDIGRNGPICFRSGLCLETQFFPDSPNKPEYPSTLLMSGEKYIEKTIYRFTVMS